MESLGGLIGAGIGGYFGGARGAAIGGGIGADLFDSGGTKAVKAGDYRSAASGTIEGKVMGARRMGIHPLYALGASTPGPAQVIPGQSKYGSIAKDAVAMMNQQAAVDQTNAQTDLLKAQASLTRAQIRELNANPNAGTPTAAPVTGEQLPPPQKTHEIVPAQVTQSQPGEPHREAGPAAPLTKRYITGYDLDGNPVTADLSQATAEELGWLFDAHRVFNNVVGHKRQREMRVYLDMFDQIMRKLTGKKSPIYPTKFQGKSGFIKR